MKAFTVPITVFLNTYTPFSWQALQVLPKNKSRKENKTKHKTTPFCLNYVSF